MAEPSHAGWVWPCFYACVISLCVLVLVIALPATGSHKINGHAVSRAVFFATEWPLYTIVIIGAAIVVSIAYALWKELPWSREAISVLVVVVWKGTKYDMVPGCLFAVVLTERSARSTPPGRDVSRS